MRLTAVAVCAWVWWAVQVAASLRELADSLK